MEARALLATFTVNSTLDAVDANPGGGTALTANGQITLRSAIQEANALAGGDTLSLPAGTYTLTIPGTGENGAAKGDLDITGDLTITGAGAGTTHRRRRQDRSHLRDHAQRQCLDLRRYHPGR